MKVFFILDISLLLSFSLASRIHFTFTAREVGRKVNVWTDSHIVHAADLCLLVMPTSSALFFSFSIAAFGFILGLTSIISD